MNRTTRISRWLLLATAAVPLVGLAQVAPDVAWTTTGLAASSLPTTEYTANGAYLLVQGGGTLQVYKTSKNALSWSRAIGIGVNAALSTDSAYVLVPTATGAVRLSVTTGNVVDTLTAAGLTGTPVAVSQFGAYIAVVTDTKAFVYSYPSMTAVTSFNTNGGAAFTPSMGSLRGGTNNPTLLVESNTAGTKAFVAKTGVAITSSSALPLATYRSGTNASIYGLDSFSNGNHHLYATNTSPVSSGELSGFFSSGTGGYVSNTLNLGGSVENTGTYLGIPTRESGSQHEVLYFVNRTDGTVASIADLNITFPTSSGAAGVRFNPQASSFVVYGLYPSASAFAYVYSYDPSTLAVSGPTPLIGGMAGTIEGHAPSAAITHGTSSGVPVTIDVAADGAATTAGTTVRASEDGSGAYALPYTTASGGTNSSVASSPSGARIAIVGNTSVKLVDVSTGAELASAALVTNAVTFIDESTIYTGTKVLTYNGTSTLGSTNSGLALSKPVASPSGAHVLGYDSSAGTLDITDGAVSAASATRSLSVPSGYGWIGENVVWATFTATTSTTVTTTVRFFDLTFAGPSGRKTRTVTFTRSAGTETWGATVSPDGLWIASWYTSGNGASTPVTGTLHFESALNAADRITDVAPVALASGITAASFSGDSSKFEYSASDGTFESLWVPIWIKSVTFSPTSVFGGNNGTATIQLTREANKAVVVSLGVSSTNLVLSSGTKTIGAGLSSVKVIVGTLGVSAQTTESLTATYNGDSVSGNLILRTPRVHSITFSPSTVTGGTSSTATVTIDGKAPPASDVTIPIVSGSTSATVPASVTIPMGTNSTTFTVNTTPVTTNTTAAITAKLPNGNRTANLTILAPTITSFTVDTQSLTGGEVAYATLNFSGPLAGDTNITVTSSNTSAIGSQTVLVPGGSTTFSYFIDTNAVLSNQTGITLTATLGSSTKIVNMTVKAPVMDFFGVDLTSVVGGDTIHATVGLTGIAPAGLNYSIVSSDTSAINSVSGTFDVGESSMVIPIATSTVSSSKTVTLTITIGSVTKHVNVNEFRLP